MLNRDRYSSISKSILHNWLIVVPSLPACFRGYFEVQPGDRTNSKTFLCTPKIRNRAVAVNASVSAAASL
jgi:hypothetical protein